MRFIFRSDYEANEFIKLIKDHISEWGYISLGDLLHKMGLDGAEKKKYTMSQLYSTGWYDTDLNIEFSREGYVVNLPERVALA